MAEKYKVVYPYVMLRVKDAAGYYVRREFYAGAPIDTGEVEVHPDDLKRHVDDGMIAEEDTPEARVMGVPAGTPIPGEPPNVPVEEGRQGPALDMTSRIENALDAAGEKPSERSERSDAESDGDARAGRPRVTDDKATWLDYRVNERVQQRPEDQSEEEARAQARTDLEGKSKADLVAGR